MTKKHSFFALFGVASLISLARADAPRDQYETFTAQSDVVNDRFTGLTWDRRALSQGAELDYVSAEGACKPNARLPSVKELLSIVDERRHSEQIGNAEVSLSIDAAAFGGIFATKGRFWTRTLASDNKASRFTVNIESGEARTLAPTELAKVRCVTYSP
jgi:hypothetical protein